LSFPGESTRLPKGHPSARQRCFNEYRSAFDDIQPHEALTMDKPVQWHEAEPSLMPRKPPPMEYRQWFESIPGA
jgi:hypothetical protein